jgi:hypothetical protein
MQSHLSFENARQIVGPLLLNTLQWIPFSLRMKMKALVKISKACRIRSVAFLLTTSLLCSSRQTYQLFLNLP